MKRACIIVTRPEPEASALAARIRAAGVRAIVSPAISISLRRAKLDFSDIGGIAFTSANGVRAFVRNSDLDAPAPPGLPAFAVGDETARAAREAGFATVTAAAGDVGSLLEVILAARTAGSVLHVCGADRAGDLAAQLRAHGVPSRHAILYEAVQQPSLSPEAASAFNGEPPPEWVVLFSPRSAEAFLAQADRAGISLSRTKGACLSKAVAKAASAGRWAALEIAAEPSSDAVLRLIMAQDGRS